MLHTSLRALACREIGLRWKVGRVTAENAVFTKHLIRPKSGEHWLLVTSAFHMPCAIGAFRQAGFPVDAYPVDY